MENCPSCERDFAYIYDYPRIKINSVEKLDLEEVICGEPTRLLQSKIKWYQKKKSVFFMKNQVHLLFEK